MNAVTCMIFLRCDVTSPHGPDRRSGSLLGEYEGKVTQKVTLSTRARRALSRCCRAAKLMPLFGKRVREAVPSFWTSGEDAETRLPDFWISGQRF